MRAVKLLLVVLIVPFVMAGAETPRKVDPRAYLTELSRLGARKTFLTDSPDVYLEPQSLNRFFTEPIYRKLQGNAYFGYRYDEGFVLTGSEVQIETIKDLTPGSGCSAAYRLALENALRAAAFQIKPAAPIQIGLCIVGIESRETPQPLPGIMVEAYFRNSVTKKSFFLRFGSGSPRSLAAALRLSAEHLVAELHILKQPFRAIHQKNAHLLQK